MNAILTVTEFDRIRRNLEQVSDTWADLWTLLSLTRLRVTQLLRCRYQDINEGIISLPGHGGVNEQQLTLSYTALAIISHRRKRHPFDIFLFQSHSRRVSPPQGPVTLIAFNTALKRASRGATHKTVSSRSALWVTTVTRRATG
ncbi:hypothetical protein DEO48_26210 [Enterobacter sp. CGMCC 5087]|nr:hypothetical protein DEO48_26210 [Enterobacter sp. CGMCC 5087]